MWTRQLLKDNAKIAFKRNYWSCVAVCFLLAILAGGPGVSLNVNTSGQSASEPNDLMQSISFEEFVESINPLIWGILLIGVLMGVVIGLLIVTFVSNVATVGSSRYFLENREHKTNVSQLFYGFQGGRYLSIVKNMFLRVLYIWGWSLLFVIPGIVKVYSYMMVPYILAENPGLDRKRVFQLSRQMMDGHKMEAFVLKLSFLGWGFLGAFTFGILNVLYVNPYMNATYAEFYSAVRAEAMSKGYVTEAELPGVALPVID